MWVENYIATYLERDLRDLSQVASLGNFRRLMGLAASRTAGMLNVSELARDAGISVSTARNYLQLLEVSYQIRRLPPYFANLGKRLVKSPKLHFRDTEIKASFSVPPKKLAGIRQFLRDFGEKAPFGVVVYLGDEPLKVAGNVLLVSWKCVI